MRLTAFRQNSSIGSSSTCGSNLLDLAIDDVTAAGLQQNSLSTDMVLGQLLIDVVRSDYIDGEYSLREGEECSVGVGEGHDYFISSLREEILCSLIATVAGEKNEFLINFYFLFLHEAFIRVPDFKS